MESKNQANESIGELLRRVAGKLSSIQIAKGTVCDFTADDIDKLMNDDASPLSDEEKMLHFATRFGIEFDAVSRALQETTRRKGLTTAPVTGDPKKASYNYEEMERQSADAYLRGRSDEYADSVHYLSKLSADYKAYGRTAHDQGDSYKADNYAAIAEGIAIAGRKLDANQFSKPRAAHFQEFRRLLCDSESKKTETRGSSEERDPIEDRIRSNANQIRCEVIDRLEPEAHLTEAYGKACSVVDNDPEAKEILTRLGSIRSLSPYLAEEDKPVLNVSVITDLQSRLDTRAKFLLRDIHLQLPF